MSNKFEVGNRVALKAFPKVPMLVIGRATADDRGFPGHYCLCSWFNTAMEFQQATLRDEWLELSGL